MHYCPSMSILLLHLSSRLSENEKTMIPISFLSYACDILANKNAGVSGSKIVEYCAAFAVRGSVSKVGVNWIQPNEEKD